MVGLFSETLHVPLVLRYPASVEAGTVVDRVFALQDLHDILLSLAGITQTRAARLSGVPEEYVISEQRRPLQVLADHAAELSTIDKRALRVRKDNLVLLRERPGNGGPPLWRFFDLDVDPREERNLWPDPRALPLREVLERFDKTSIVTGATPLIEGNLREQLQALGYLAEH
jgi:arylsulfatase A-like enzyme